MRLAIDASRSTAARRTGTEAYSLYLIRALLDSRPPPHHITLYFRDVPAPGLFPARGATRRVRGMLDHAPRDRSVWTLESSHITLKALPMRRLWTHLRFARALYADRPDLTFVPAHTLPFMFPGAGVVTVHDLGYRHVPEAHPTLARLYLDLTTRHSARRARHILADSEATRRDLIHCYRVPADKISVVYPGVDPTLAPARDPEAWAAVRAAYEIPGPYLLYLGSIQPRKNLQGLIEAYAAAQPAQHLVIAGKRGWLYEDIFRSVQRLGLAGRVHFPGFIDQAHIAALYSGATAFLFPSLYEGFGFPVLEAMTCGVPVLCAKTSSLPEIAGDAALLVNPKDTDAIAAGIHRLSTDPGLRARLVEAGYAQAARFTWEAAARTTWQIFEMVGPFDTGAGAAGHVG